MSNDRGAHSAMYRPTGLADKIDTRISEVMFRYRSCEEKRAKCRSSYLSFVRADRRVVREYFPAIPRIWDLRAALVARETERKETVISHSSRDPARRIRTKRHSSTCNHSRHPRPPRLIHSPRGPAYKTAPEFGGVRDHVSRAIRISREWLPMIFHLGIVRDRPTRHREHASSQEYTGNSCGKLSAECSAPFLLSRIKIVFDTSHDTADNVILQIVSYVQGAKIIRGSSVLANLKNKIRELIEVRHNCASY